MLNINLSNESIAMRRQIASAACQKTLEYTLAAEAPYKATVYYADDNEELHSVADMFDECDARHFAINSPEVFIAMYDEILRLRKELENARS